MFSLDIKTVLLGYAISNGICTLVMVLMWLYNRSRSKGLGFWSVGYGLQFTGIVLIALRDIAPDFISIVLSNCLIIIGGIMIFIGLERFTGQSSSQSFNLLLVIGFFAIQYYYGILQPNLMMRSINVAAALLIIYFEIFWLMVHRASSENRRINFWFGVVLGALCLVSIAAIVTNIIAPPSDNDLLRSGFSLTLSFMGYQMGFLSLTFCLFLLVNRSLYYDLLRDISERNQAEQDLRQRAEELQRLMDTAPIAILMARDPKCQVINGNQMANCIYGAQEGENISVSTPGDEPIAARRFFQDGRELLPAELPIQKATAEGIEILNAEIQVLLSNGKTMTMLGAATPLYDPQDKVRGAVGAFMDITERKRAEEKLRAALEEKEILLREVHHRVKNNLQAIVHLIEMQTKNISDSTSQAFLKELGDQARTMSLVYEQVYQSENLAHISMAPYLKKLAANVLISLGRQHDVRLDLDIASVTLNVEKAMPCGLVVNELVTNSLKYAFQPDPQSQPTINISLQPAGDSYRLRVSDNGVGLPADFDIETSRSQGLRLVRLWATHQLNGELKTTNDPGATYEITF